MGQRSSVSLEHSLYSYSKVPRDRPSLPEVSIDQQWAYGRGLEAKLHTHVSAIFEKFVEVC
jgi:hypothetical protein